MSQGRLVANWYVFCNLCNAQGQHTRPRTTSVRTAEKHLMDVGWRYHWEMVMGKRMKYWTCPECVKTNDKFLRRCRA